MRAAPRVGTSAPTGWTGELARALARPVDATALAAFRIVFGSLLIVAVVRFGWKGSVASTYVEPAHLFPHWPLGFLRPLPGAGMYAVFAALALAAVCLAAGLYARASAAAFCLLFSYAHVLDRTVYLNHYYLVTLLTGLVAFLPIDRAWSVDARWRRRAGVPSVPAWTLYLLRFQVGCVYFFGGVAKLKADWLLHAMPLRIWLPANGDVPLLGPLFRYEATAYAMSWAGALYDLSVPFLLLARATRPWAYAAVVVFHLLTARLFNIGMFPYFMMACSLLFLDPGWARRLVGGARGVACEPPLSRSAAAPAADARVRPRLLVALGAYVVVQLLAPLRYWLYPGDVLWTEEGFRFAWNVMLVEKNGAAEFTLRDRATGAERPVRVRDRLTPYQVKAMATQPDLVLDFARLLADEERRRGRDVAVFADVLVSLNGRPPRRLVDPAVDLARERDGLGAKRWILPGPTDAPP